MIDDTKNTEIEDEKAVTKISILLYANEAKSLVLNDGLSFYWKNKIDAIRWEPTIDNGFLMDITVGDARDLLMLKDSIPQWFFERVVNAIFKKMDQMAVLICFL